LIIAVFAGQAWACGCGFAFGIAPPRFNIKIDEKTPWKDLLPTAPEMTPAGKAILIQDLAKVPEIQFASDGSLQNAERIARQLAAINHLNAQSTDHFVELLLSHRPDLAGLPFTLGDACRLGPAQAKKFSVALALAKIPFLAELGKQQGEFKPVAFWQLHGRYTGEMRESQKQEKDLEPYVPENRHSVAALMQIFTGQPVDWQLSLASRLQQFDQSDADKNAVTEALVKLAVFSPEESVREKALKGLKGRDTKAATGIVLKGLRYPWPSVARRAAELVVQLRRTDLVRELGKMLDEPDPRAPVMKDVKWYRAPVLHEVVRVNHLRNCMLCHPGVDSLPAFTGTSDIAKASGLFLSGSVPVPGTPPPSGYASLAPPIDLLVRADVTYLRQDFSLLEKVANAAPWPDVQRFDYLVRSRVLSDQEKTEYDALFAGRPHEYRDIAFDTLRRLNEQ